MARGLATLAIVGLTLSLPLIGQAEEPWYSVHRSDHRDWTVSVTGGLSMLDLDGRGTVDEGLGDTNISLDGTLDLSGIASWWGEIDLQLLRGQHLRFAYTPMGFDGNEVLDTAIVVDGITYDIGDLVDSDLKLDQYEISFRSEFWFGEYVSIAPVVQVTLVDASVKIENQTLGITEKESALLPLPYLGLRAEVYPLARLGLFAEAKGFTIGSKASVWDVSGGLSLHLTRNFSLMGRYRLSDYAVEFSDSKIDLNVGGLFFGGTVRF
jgi:hypothetical protein